jgi:hypothetical protein
MHHRYLAESLIQLNLNTLERIRFGFAQELQFTTLRLATVPAGAIDGVVCVQHHRYR